MARVLMSGQRASCRPHLTVAEDYMESCWLGPERPEPSLCLLDPGFDVDLYVTADTVALHHLWMGQSDWPHALRARLIVLDGRAALCRAFSTWLALGYYAARPIGET
jgi:hypothetical protein